MKIELTDVSPVKKTLEVEVDAETVAHETDHVLRHLGQRARVPGFRPGKAPIAVIRKRYGDAANEEVRDRLIGRLYRQATEEKQLRPIGDPVLDDLHFEAGEPFRFKATFEVLPKFELKDYKGVEARRPVAEVSDEDVERALEELRESRAQLVAVEGRAAEQDDYLVAEVAGTPSEGEPFQQEKALIHIGSENNLPAFNEALIGAEPGKTVEFTVEFPEDQGAEELKGRSVDYRIQVHEVKRKQVPELDDELAKDLGDFDDLAALRARVTQDLELRARAEGERAIRQTIMDKVLLENPIPLPEVLVESEIRHRLEDLVRNMYMQGVDPEKLDLDWKEIRDKQEEPARKAVHARLVLDAVAEIETLEVSRKEIEERIRRDAARIGEKPETLREQLKKGRGTEALRSQLLREKSLDLLVSVANIQNEESS